MKEWVYQPYEKDQIVEHRGKYYVAVEDKNLSEPNDVYANWLYVFFHYLNFSIFFDFLIFCLFNLLIFFNLVLVC